MRPAWGRSRTTSASSLPTIVEVNEDDWETFHLQEKGLMTVEQRAYVSHAKRQRRWLPLIIIAAIFSVAILYTTFCDNHMADESAVLRLAAQGRRPMTTGVARPDVPMLVEQVTSTASVPAQHVLLHNEYDYSDSEDDATDDIEYGRHTDDAAALVQQPPTMDIFSLAAERGRSHSEVIIEFEPLTPEVLVAGDSESRKLDILREWLEASLASGTTGS